MHPDEIRRVQNYNRNIDPNDPDYDDSLEDIDVEEELFEAEELNIGD